MPNWVGTPGQVINAYADFYKGPERLDELAVPTDDALGHAVAGRPRRHARRADRAVHLRAGQDAYRKAKLGMLGGVDTYMAQNVRTHTVGVATGTTPPSTARTRP